MIKEQILSAPDYMLFSAMGTRKENLRTVYDAALNHKGLADIKETSHEMIMRTGSHLYLVESIADSIKADLQIEFGLTGGATGVVTDDDYKDLNPDQWHRLVSIDLCRMDLMVIHEQLDETAINGFKPAEYERKDDEYETSSRRTRR